MNALEYIKQYRTTHKVDFDAPSPIVLNHFGRSGGIIDMFEALDYRFGAEVGTDSGIYARELCSRLPNLKLFCIDPWMQYVEDGRLRTQEEMDILYWRSFRRLSPYKCSIIKKTSMEGVKDIPTNLLDFVFIDGNHTYPYVYEDITEWTKRVRPGGIIYGHDYVEGNEVSQAVNQYMLDNKVSQWFILHVPAHEPKRNRANFIDGWMFIKNGYS